MKEKHFVIIGSGLAGTIISNILAKGHKVSVLEKGKSKKLEYPNLNFIKKSFGESKTFCYGLGGTTNLWHNGLIKLDPSHIQGSNFKRVIKESESYADEAACMLNLKLSYTSAYESILKKYNSLTNTITGAKFDLDTIIMPQASGKLSLSNKVSVYTSVTRLEFHKKNDIISSVSFCDENSNSKKLVLDELIICAGGLGSFQIVNKLLENGDAGARTRSTTLIDHPMGFLGKIKVSKKYDELFSKFVNSSSHGFSSRAGIKGKAKGLNYICYFRPAVTLGNSLSIYKFKSKLGTATWFKRLGLLFDIRIIHPDIIAEIMLFITGKILRKRVYSVWFVFEQNKVHCGENYVDGKNGNLEISWEISSEEKEAYSKAINDVREILSPFVTAANFQTTNIEKYLWSAAHYSGTLAVGPGQVLNNNLELKGFKNVCVCDGSVIQEHSYANTGLTIAQLSVRLAKFLSGKYDAAK